MLKNIESNYDSINSALSFFETLGKMDALTVKLHKAEKKSLENPSTGITCVINAIKSEIAETKVDLDSVTSATSDFVGTLYGADVKTDYIMLMSAASLLCKRISSPFAKFDFLTLKMSNKDTLCKCDLRQSISGLMEDGRPWNFRACLRDFGFISRLFSKDGLYYQGVSMPANATAYEDKSSALNHVLSYVGKHDVKVKDGLVGLKYNVVSQSRIEKAIMSEIQDMAFTNDIINGYVFSKKDAEYKAAKKAANKEFERQYNASRLASAMASLDNSTNEKMTVIA